MRSIERLSPFCQTMICQGRIPYLLPNIRRESEGSREIQYQVKGKRPLAKVLETGLEEDVFRIARRIVFCYYDLETEYFVPGSSLCLELESIHLDRDGELFFMLDDAACSQLYPIIRRLLSDRWKEHTLIPADKEDWLELIESCEERERLSRQIIMAPEDPEYFENEGLLARILEAKDDLIRDDRKVLGLWAGCFVLGVILSVFS